MTDNESFYQPHLDRVSRSFALCIQQLKSPARGWVGLSYILCRLLDSIEDSAWSSTDEQDRSFREFQSFVESPRSSEEIRAWASRFPIDLPSGEVELLAAAPRFFDDFHRLSARAHDPIRVSVLNMARGMSEMARRFKRGEQIALRSLTEVNQYCFFVAGVVGELLTEIFAVLTPDWKPTPETYLDGFHFGLFLQKVNILKDYAPDLQAGRNFTPDRAQLRSSVLTHARRSLRYLLSLPTSATDIRTFCAWSFFLGLASLPHIDRAYAEGKPHKISRVEALALMTKIGFKINSNDQLTELFAQYAPADFTEDFGEQRSDMTKSSAGALAPATMSTATTATTATTTTRPDLSWLEKIYSGRLQQSDLNSLGLRDPS